MILAQGIAREGVKAVAAGLAPMELRRGIDKAVTALVDELKRRSKPVSTEAEIAQVGTISANGEAEIGRLIAQAMQKVGKVSSPSRIPRGANRVLLPFELMAHGGADEIGTIGVEAVADHEIHASQIDEAEVDGDLLAVGRLRSKLVNRTSPFSI
jgi:hypothetical protein